MKTNKEILNIFKFGYFFHFRNGLLYFKGNDSRDRLIILFDLVFEFLQNIYDNKYYFDRDRIL